MDFSPVPVAASIPANDSIVLRLMGTPLKTGDLYIRGCIIKITGFAEQEFLIEKQIKEVNSRDDVTQKEEPFRLKYR